MVEVSTAEVENGPVPEGAKRVREVHTRTEIFQEPTGSKPSAETLNSITCGACKQTHELEEWEENDDDCPACFPNSGPAANDRQLTAVEQLLENLGQRKAGESDEVSFYVIRLKDELGARFQNPSNVKISKGLIPFDDTLVTPAAIELAVQSAWGGGKYQIQLIINTKYGKSWTVTIDDADNNGAAGNHAQAQQAAVVVEPSGPRQQLSETLDVLKDILAITSKARPQMELPAGYVAPPPPPSMASQISEIAGVMTALKSLTGDNGSNGKAPARSTAVEIADGITTGVERLATAFGVPAIMQAAAPYMVGAFVASRQAAAAKAAVEPQPQNNGQANGHQAPPVEAAASIAVTPPAMGNATFQAAPPALSMPLPEPPPPPAVTGPNPADVAALHTALAVVVEQMVAYDEIDHDTVESEKLQDVMIMTAAEALSSCPREVLTPIATLYLTEGASAVISTIAAERPDWKVIGNLESGITYVKSLITTLQELEAQGTRPAHQAPDLGELETLVGSGPQTPDSGLQTIEDSGGGAPVPGQTAGATSEAKGDAPPVYLSSQSPAAAELPPVGVVTSAPGPVVRRKGKAAK